MEAERKLYMEKLRRMEERLNLQRRTELQATEERKNEQIERLTRNHEKAFIDMKDYYHSVTANNIDLIDNLKVCSLFGSLVQMFAQALTYSEAK